MKALQCLPIFHMAQSYNENKGISHGGLLPPGMVVSKPISLAACNSSQSQARYLCSAGLSVAMLSQVTRYLNLNMDYQQNIKFIFDSCHRSPVSTWFAESKDFVIT